MPEKTPDEVKPAKPADLSKNADGPRSFSSVLLQIADGDCHEQASQDLQRLVRTIGIRAREQAKSVKGVFTLKITITGDQKDILDVGYDVKIDEPKAKRARTVFWADKSGNVTEKNPRQTELPMGSLRDVSARTATREVHDDTETRDA